MSLAETYVKSLQTAKSLTVIDAIKPSIARNWAGFTVSERDAINAAGAAAKERIASAEPQRPEPSENMPGEYAYKSKGMPKGEVMHKSYRPPQEEPAEMPYRATFERLTENYARCSTRDEVRAVRNEVDELSRQGQLMIWQSRELFVSDIAALRRVFELDPPKVSPETQRFLDELIKADGYIRYDELLQEALPYSMQLERADSREWWVLEHAFELKSAELRQKARASKQQAIPI